MKPSPKTPPTQQDVAKALGIARSTVSRALQNSPKIPEAHRKEIQEAAQAMGYQPNPMATALSHQRQLRHKAAFQSTLAWFNCWPDPKKLRSFREFELYWQGAVQSANKLGYQLEEFVVGPQMPMDRLEKILLARNICGVLLPPTGVTHPDWGVFSWDHFSAVHLGTKHPTLPVHSVTSDQGLNAMLAFKKILEKGYRRIGFVGSRWHRRMFGAGYFWAQAQHPGQNLPPLLSDSSPVDEHLLSAWLKKNKPDAILTEYPDLPLLLEKQGLRVPDDVGLATTSVLDCPIDAGIYQNSEEIGRVGVLVLASLIHDNDHGIPSIHRQILIEGSWVDGKSLPSKT
jgi:DNA-binding LacI/PurR family transcriptional regulator